MRVLGWLAVAGCGRIGFGAVGDAAPGAGADGDGSTQPLLPCPVGASAPDPLMVTGRAVRVSFIGTVTGEGNVTAALLDRIGGTTLGSATTSGNGDFSFTVPTGGHPIVPYVTLSKSGLLTSVYIPDEATDQPISFAYGFMGTDLGVGSLYSAGNTSRNTSLGTLFVTVTDCSGTGLSGATISLSPPAEKIVYSNNLGVPSSSATQTGPSGYAWALNVPVGSTMLTAALSGATFVPHTVDVLGGSNFMGSTMRPVP
jgi:hypothetical protein